MRREPPGVYCGRPREVLLGEYGSADSTKQEIGDFWENAFLRHTIPSCSFYFYPAAKKEIVAEGPGYRVFHCSGKNTAQKNSNNSCINMQIFFINFVQKPSIGCSDNFITLTIFFK